jgi:hypothetical protein
MAATARSHLLNRVQERDVLVIQDPTSLRDDGDKRGLYLHPHPAPAIVADAADGALPGLLTADFLVRDGTPKAIAIPAGQYPPAGPEGQPPLGGRDAACGRSAGGRVSLPRPKRNHPHQAAALPTSVALTLLDVREIDAPAGETALHWPLLTTRAVEDWAGARQIVAFYRGRWDIEQIVRVMKTRGFDIEAVPIQDDVPRKNLPAPP